MPKKSDLSRFVILRTDRIGEVVLSTAAVGAIRKVYPDARIDYVTSSYSRDVLEGSGGIERVMTADTASKRCVLTRAARLASKLRRGRYDVAIALNPHKMLHLGLFLAGIGVRAGFDRKWSFFLNAKIKDERDAGKKHEVEYTMDLLRRIGIDRGPGAPFVALDCRSEEFIGSFLKENGAENHRPLVVVHPGSSNPAKVWPSARYADLLRKLRATVECDIAVTGDEKEKGLVADIVGKIGGSAINCAGKLDLKKLAALLKKASLFIGNDTGPMHMAAALGVPVVAIFCGNIVGAGPVRWRPWGDGHVVFCGDIAVDDVLGAALKKIGEGGGPE